MKSELEKLREQLEKAQKKLAALQEEKANMDNYIDKGGKISKSVSNYYSEICKLIYAAENVIGNIEKQIIDIKAMESQKENGSYRLSKGMIPYRTLKCYEAMDEYRQVDIPNQDLSDDNTVVIDVDPEEYEQSEEDYLSKDRKKRIAQRAIIAALLVGIGAASVKIYDEIKKTNKQDNQTIEQPVAPETDNSIAYDYEENVVTITPEPTPSNPFINVNGYNEAYLKNYENTKELYNTTAEDAVEYVNDAYKILETKFYGEEATIDDIINVIVTIRTGNLYTEDNVSILRPIDSVLNLITDNYIFGVPAEEDITKLSALQYFAKEGTDLDKFLTRYYQLLVDVLRNPYDGIYKDNLYNFLNVYASNINNGYVNEPELTTGNEEIDNDAKLDSYYDFQLSHDCFVFDTLPLLQSTVNDPNAGSQEDIDRSNRALELQDLLYTAVHDLMQDCEPSLTLGGE